MDAKYLEKFDWMARRLEELSIAVAQPDIIADLPRWQSLLRERAALEPAVSAYHDYQKLTGEIADARELSEDPELGETAPRGAEASGSAGSAAGAGAFCCT